MQLHPSILEINVVTNVEFFIEPDDFNKILALAKFNPFTLSRSSEALDFSSTSNFKMSQLQPIEL